MDPVTMGYLVSTGVSVFGSIFGNKKAEKQQKEQNALAKRQVELAESEYYQKLQARQEWSEKYGSIEHNMIQYVRGLSADKEYAKADGRIKQSFEQARKVADSHLAARGFDVAGGVHAEMFQEISDREAMMSAKYKQKAEEYVFNAQQSLLNNNRQPAVASTVGMQNANINQQNALTSGYKAVNDAYTDTGDALGRAINKYYDRGKTGTQIRKDLAFPTTNEPRVTIESATAKGVKI